MSDAVPSGFVNYLMRRIHDQTGNKKKKTQLGNIKAIFCNSTNTLVLNHFHSIKSLLFSSARPHAFNGMLGTGLLESMYTTKTPIDM